MMRKPDMDSETSSPPSAYLDSEILSSLRGLIEVYPVLKKIAGPLVQFDIVLDANEAIADLLYKYNRPCLKYTALEEVARSSAVRLYAPVWLETEMVTSTIPQVSRKKGIPLDQLMRAWESYKRIIIWDDRFSVPDTSESDVLDVKDIPYVQLQKCLSALGILSKDKDIDALGGTRIDRELVMTIRTYGRAASYSVSLKVGGVIVSRLSLSLFKQIVTSLGGVIAKMPDGMKLALLVGGFIIVAHPSSRAWLFGYIRNFGQEVVDTWPKIEKVLEFIAEKSAAEQDALAEVKRTVAPYALPTSPE